MKIIYDSIQFELTRRCNQSCMHCCRGESQNIDITKEVIDAFFDKNDIIAIETISFSGGEPTLNGEALEYIVDKIIEKEIKVSMFIMAINGLSYSESLVRGLNKLNKYCDQFSIQSKKHGTLVISQSQYHRKADKEVIAKLSKLPYFIKPEPYVINPKILLPYGNALKNGLTTNVPNIDKVIDYNSSFQVSEYRSETYICFESQYISSNGNVMIDGCVSYDIMDEYNIGNVLEKSIVEMYSEQPKMLKFFQI